MAWVFDGQVKRDRHMDSAPDQPHSRYEHVYPIVRVDLYIDAQVSPEHAFSIVKVLTSKAAAELETARLIDLNKGKECKYFFAVSRLVPE